MGPDPQGKGPIIVYYQVLPSDWSFAIGDTVIPKDPAGFEQYLVIDRASDVSGVACYRIVGTDVDGWSDKAALEQNFKVLSSGTVVIHEGDPDGLE